MKFEGPFKKLNVFEGLAIAQSSWDQWEAKTDKRNKEIYLYKVKSNFVSCNSYCKIWLNIFFKW